MINPGRAVRTGPGRYTVLLVGLGAAGVAIGWRSETGRPRALIRRR